MRALIAVHGYLKHKQQISDAISAKLSFIFLFGHIKDVNTNIQILELDAQ